MDNFIAEIEQLLKSDLPKDIWVNDHTYCNDTIKFIQSHLSILRKHGNTKCYKIYYEQLEGLKNKLNGRVKETIRRD